MSIKNLSNLASEQSAPLSDNERANIKIYLDDSTTPLVEYAAPYIFDFDTRTLSDGEHTMRIVSSDSRGVEGVRIIPFVVRNGPAISIDGLRENAIVDGVLPIMVNSYSKGDQRKFLIQGSETPRGIPAWLWVIMIGFVAWAIFYGITFWGK